LLIQAPWHVSICELVAGISRALHQHNTMALHCGTAARGFSKKTLHAGGSGGEEVPLPCNRLGNAAVLYSMFADPSNVLEHKQHPLQPSIGS
jgi:hypothetical protein